MMMVTWLFVFFFLEFFKKFQTIYRPISVFRPKEGTVQIAKLATVLRTIWFDLGLSGSMLFSHREVSRVKKVAIVNGSW